MLLRVGNMRGIDLSTFDFDYDMQWQALMLSADGVVLGRFGGRDADTPGKYQTLAGLRHSLEAALRVYKIMETKSLVRTPVRAEDYPAAAQRADNACIHCHHVYEFRRDKLQREGRWTLDEVWVYPQPENLGLSLDINQGDRVVTVAPKSLAAKLGVKANDRLKRIDNTPIASVADVQYALHKAPKSGNVTLLWQSRDQQKTGTIALPEGWRKTDVSWRWSLKSLAPNPSIVGEDLDLDGRKKLGLDARQLAFRQMNFVTRPGRFAGLQANDVIVGINDQMLNMTARQFETHIRLNHRVGEEIVLNVIRGKERLKLKMKLPE